jgi:hypothetical protein
LRRSEKRDDELSKKGGRFLVFGVSPMELLFVGFIATLLFGPRLYRHLRALYDAAPPEARQAPFRPNFIVAIVVAEALLLAILLSSRFGR